METDLNKTLADLEPINDIKPELESSIVLKSRVLYNTPLAEFNIEDLRFMIGQGFGLKVLVPLAIERLEESPFIEGDYYPGDLLWSILTINQTFWRDNPNLYWRLFETTNTLLPLMSKLENALREFQNNMPKS